MSLTADRNLDFFASQELIELGVDASTVIYKGSFVGRNRTTGYARPLQAGDEFVGVAYAKCDNTYAGNSAGGKNVKLHQRVDVVHALTSVAVSDIGKTVYASDESTLTLSTAGNSRIGRIVSVEASGIARVRCEPLPSLSGVLENFPVTSLSDASVTLTADQMNRVFLIGNTAARTITLPAAATCRAGAWFAVLKTSSAAFAVTLDGNSSETIDGATTLATIDAQFDTALLICTGSEWIVLARDIS